MNDDSIKIISEVLTGSYYKTIRLGDSYHTAFAPWTETLARAAAHLSGLIAPGEHSGVDTMFLIPDHAQKIASFIAVLIVGNVKRWGWIEKYKFRKAFKAAIRTTEEQKKEAFRLCLSLINGSDFFEYASWGVELSQQLAKAKQE